MAAINIRCLEKLRPRESAGQAHRRQSVLRFAWIACCTSPPESPDFIGVALGAFAAHGLKARLEPQLLAAFETGVRYQMYHVFALLAAAWGHARWQGRWFGIAGWLFVTGIALFSGSLYLLALTASAGQAQSHPWVAWPSWAGGSAWRGEHAYKLAA
jgi:uncharacterized membrane protein YgdD (TMEM256/DUF423 family)